MTVHSFAELKQLWISEGGNPAYAAMAAAVGLAESGGNDQAISKVNSNGTRDYGIWQISLKGGNGGMLDPNANAKRAIQMSNDGTNWKPWCTAYGDGACGTKGGKYLAPSSPFYPHLNGTGGAVPTPPAFNGGTTDTSKLAGQLGSGLQTQTVGLQTVSSKNDCLISLPSVVGIGGGCLLSKSQGRAIIGAGILVMGGTVLLIGTALLVSKATGVSLPKTALMAAAPEAAPAIEAADKAKPKSSMPKPKVFDANGTEISPREANNSPSKRQAYRAQEAAKNPPTVHTSSDGSTF